MSVKRAMREIDSAEFAEWMAYDLLEPFGPRQEDARAGMVAALIANVNRDTSKRPEPYSVEDFFPGYQDVSSITLEAAKPVNLEDKLRTWALAMSDTGKARPKSELREKTRKR